MGSSFRVFVSFRFSEARDEAFCVQKELNDRGISCFVCDENPGDNLAQKISEALANAELVVILGSKTYGIETKSSFSTCNELDFTLHEKAFFLVKMCDEFAVPATRLKLPSSYQYESWSPGKPMPNGFIDRVIKKLNKISGITTAVPATTVQPAAVPATTVQPVVMSATTVQPVAMSATTVQPAVPAPQQQQQNSPHQQVSVPVQSAPSATPAKSCVVCMLVDVSLSAVQMLWGSRFEKLNVQGLKGFALGAHQLYVASLPETWVFCVGFGFFDPKCLFFPSQKPCVEPIHLVFDAIRIADKDEIDQAQDQVQKLVDQAKKLKVVPGSAKFTDAFQFSANHIEIVCNRFGHVDATRIMVVISDGISEPDGAQSSADCFTDFKSRGGIVVSGVVTRSNPLTEKHLVSSLPTLQQCTKKEEAGLLDMFNCASEASALSDAIQARLREEHWQFTATSRLFLCANDPNSLHALVLALQGAE